MNIPDQVFVKKACFITLEGGEGCGKSTQMARLGDGFEKARLPFLRTREPGGSEGAEKIRQLLVTGKANAWDAVSETLLFYAARRDHVERTIKPALVEGTHVLCDRFADSTYVYQGIGKGMERSVIDQMHHIAIGDFKPDLTLILDIDPQIGLERAKSRRGQETRFESMELAFHTKVREGFLALAEHEPKRCKVIDASGTLEQVQSAIAAAVKAQLGFTL